MALAERVDNQVVVQSPYRERELIKTIPGGRYRKEDSNWIFPLSWATCVQLRETFGEDLQIGQNLNDWAAGEILTRIKPCLQYREAQDAPELSMFSSLFPYQRAGVWFLMHAKQALVADEMGLGKTVQAIATLEATAAYPALIVCPNSMKRVWEAEFKKWAPGREVRVVQGSAAKRRKALEDVRNGEAEVAIMNWEQLRHHSRLAAFGSTRSTDAEKEPKELNSIDWVSVVADEAHRAKDPSAKQTRALWAVGHQATVQYRFALTGTPIANSPEDIWSLMHFIAPHEWPSKSKYIDRYALQSWNTFGFMDVVGIKPAHKDEFFKILDPRMLRRLKKAVLSDPTQRGYIPDKLPTITRYVEMTGKQKKAYEQLKKEMIAEIDGGILLASSPLTRVTRLRQFASASGVLSPQLWQIVWTGQKDGTIVDVPVQVGFETREHAEMYVPAANESTGQNCFVKPMKRDLTLTEPSCKVDGLMEVVDELGGQQAVVFAESRQLIELAAIRLMDSGHTVVQVTGAVSPDIRAQNVDAFQASRVQFILVTLGAGGEGLTLTAARTGIFLQRSYSLVKNAQAEDRLHRPGQHEAVQIINIVTADTIDEKANEIVEVKGERLEEIVRDEESLRRWLS